MKIKFLISVFIIIVIPGYSYAYSGNCDANNKKTGYVQAIYLGVDNGNDGSVTFKFLPKGSKEALTLSFYNYISSKHNTILPDDMVAAQNARAAYTLLLTAYSSGSPIKIMRCYGNGVVALGMGQGSL
ncbi:hypothetical protein M5U04_18145 [Xenorhabdus sp. XENO-1]|uniref:hypothetical protein n=1 Tax=Xenorhabdus bovienii TaxID=40576 RepID=UPI0020CA5EB2|nr:hypothetical protein [Xenorhabdus bovienii]MCP9269952.1 hypothetical protein [Xenorhabdus bovienii subsp. africana]